MLLRSRDHKTLKDVKWVLYEELVGLRFRSLSFLADVCGEDVTARKNMDKATQK
jgi:hypothetical protein